MSDAIAFDARRELRYCEDYHAGEVFELGTRTIDESEIVEFARRYDPMPFHVDPVAAATSIYGGLTASGWQTALIAMRLMHDGFLCARTSLGSPGIDGLSWLLPVRPGDVLRGRVEIIAVRVSKSRPEIGFVTNVVTLANQHGELVYRAQSVAIFSTRASERATNSPQETTGTR